MPTKKRHTLTGKTLVSYKTQVGAFCPITEGILSGGHFVQGAFCASPHEATDQWRKRLKACVKANGRHFERLLNCLNCFVSALT